MEKGLPEFLQNVIEKYPKAWEGYSSFGAALSNLPGIDKRTQQLVKLGIAVGAGSEGAVHSHVRRCKEAGVSDDEVYHAALLSATTIGWPFTVAALSWIDDILKVIRSEASR